MNNVLNQIKDFCFNRENIKNSNLIILILVFLSLSTFSIERKKVVIIQAERDEFVVQGKVKLMETLEKEYLSKNNLEIYNFYWGDYFKKQKDYLEYNNVVEKMDQIKPDLIMVIGANTDFLNKGVDKLQETNYPIVINIWAERYVNENGYANKNITGVYMMSEELQRNAFKLLNEISPIESGKAVFITGFNAFEKKIVSTNLKEAVNGELKDFISINYIEELEKEIKIYNEDKDIKWILHGYNVVNYKNGELITWVEALQKYNRILQKKPNVTYWETVVKEGAAVAGLCADIKEDGISVAEMGIEILNGKSVKEIKARSPRNQNIILNLKHAQDIGVEIPFDILAGAYRIYTDYEGNYIEQKF